MEQESTTGLEDADDFGVEVVFVCDVHLDVLGPYDIEGIVIKREVEGGGLLEMDAIAKIDEPGEFDTDLNVFVGKVDAVDVAVVCFGEVTRGAAKSTADIKDEVGGLDIGEFGEFQCGVSAACVKGVDGGEVVDREVLEVFAGVGET